MSIVLLGASAAGLAGCGGPAIKEPDLTAALVDSGIPPKTAACVSKALTRSLTADELTQLAERGGGGAPVDDPKVPDESADKLNAAMVKCREVLLVEQPTTTTTTALESVTSTTLPGDGAEFNTTSTP